MAKGQAAVDWKNPENNAKLFAAVLTLIPGTPDYKKIAAVFGPNVPANAISYRLGVVRKEGQALGLQVGSGSGSGSTSVKTKGMAKLIKPTTKKTVAKGKGCKRGHVSDDESDDADVVKDEEESGAETNAHEKTPATPKRSAKRQKTTKGGVSKRVSPRKPNKTDYKKLADPSNSEDNAEEEDAEEEDAKDEDAEDEDGSNVSGYEDEDKASDDASEAGSEASSSGTSWEGPDRSKVSYYYMGPNVSDSEEEAA